MKARHTILFFLSLFLIMGTGNKILAQQSKDEQAIDIEKEKKMEAKAAQEAELRARKEMLEQQQDEMRNQEMEYAEHVREASRAREVYRSSGVADVEPVVRVAPFYFQETQTQLTLRNSFRGSTDSSKGVFDVESGTRYFRCMINGRVNSGEIYIKISYPGGKVFKELTINSSAEISFSQSLNIKEGEDSKYIGSWQYEVKADKAEGNYMLQISYN
jgi:cell division protein FtsB